MPSHSRARHYVRRAAHHARKSGIITPLAVGAAAALASPMADSLPLVGTPIGKAALFLVGGLLLRKKHPAVGTALTAVGGMMLPSAIGIANPFAPKPLLAPQASGLDAGALYYSVPEQAGYLPAAESGYLDGGEAGLLDGGEAGALVNGPPFELANAGEADVMGLQDG